LRKVSPVKQKILPLEEENLDVRSSSINLRLTIQTFSCDLNCKYQNLSFTFFLKIKAVDKILYQAMVHTSPVTSHPVHLHGKRKQR